MSPAVRHIAPFVAWIALMHFLDLPQLDPAVAYAIRSVVCLGLFLWLRPWVGYAGPAWRHVPLALLVGVGVLAIWVGMETAWMKANAPALSAFYERWAVLPLGKLREPLTSTPYAPEVCGWPLTMARILGSGLVIAVIEEFFWRSFLYRWMFGNDFMKTDAGRFAWGPFLMVAAVFASAHRELLPAFLCGLAYGWLYIRTRDVWMASLAHIVTNLLLGAYVVHTGSYQFW